MSSQQLRLFDTHPKPLLDRLGKEFFKAVPPSPGVYLMHSQHDKVLYVGQSGNLRSRLNSYKNANPAHLTRKVIRLVHEASHISYEVCGTHEKARLRENDLLRSLRPKFNRTNTFPKAHCFIGVKYSKGALALCLTRQAPAAGQFFGAFKSGALYAYGALLRLLWALWNRPLSLDSYPRRLLLQKPPAQFELALTSPAGLDCPPPESIMLEEFLSGDSDSLTPRFEAELNPSCLFHKKLIADDLEILRHFYDFGPRRNKALRTHHQLEGQLILQEQLDDLLVTDLWREVRPKLFPPEPSRAGFPEDNLTDPSERLPHR
ncbi:MAG TPA: nucleotide excision repair endonuclease [Candidatus Saccharimonadales bacterium]|nr:nucleotide excision repair endonuclease [Candidatus Saccharimonadales bacterium]